ncbi:DUF6950 family protein [Vibrio cincinnatiensis]|uniref:DUF6950 family protein n=1 Tax=Vibrio cincinnatiensis TaxID=675 RepID=UPI001FAA5AB0|nr:hypothetical protein [Vibrio cincinnatiensis]
MSKIELLTDFLNAYRDRPFETGQNDCALFISDWFRLLTGIDFSCEFRGGYSSDAGSAKLIADKGYGDLFGLVSTVLDEHGVRLETPKLAQRGDFVWCQRGDVTVCGIVGSGGIYALSTNGLVCVPLRLASIAWRVELGVNKCLM